MTIPIKVNVRLYSFTCKVFSFGCTVATKIVPGKYWFVNKGLKVTVRLSFCVLIFCGNVFLSLHYTFNTFVNTVYCQLSTHEIQEGCRQIHSFRFVLYFVIKTYVLLIKQDQIYNTFIFIFYVSDMFMAWTLYN